MNNKRNFNYWQKTDFSSNSDIISSLLQALKLLFHIFYKVTDSFMKRISAFINFDDVLLLELFKTFCSNYYYASNCSNHKWLNYVVKVIGYTITMVFFKLSSQTIVLTLTSNKMFV